MNENRKVNENKPVLTLDMDEKIYLAVAKNDLDKLAFVYTLACLKTNKKTNTYSMGATREIHVFKDINAANIYYEAINQIVDINSTGKKYKVIFDTHEKMIEAFNNDFEKGR